MKNIFIAARLFFLLSVLTGLIYPFVVTGAAQTFFPEKANGSLLRKDNVVRGSFLIAQDFRKEVYFWPRPSAVNYDSSSSGGSNLGPTSLTLQKELAKRRAAGLKDDLLFTSGSGLDPDISPAAAMDQLERVAKARGLDENRKESLRSLIQNSIMGREWGFLGEPRINVLRLNIALDKEFK